MRCDRTERKGRSSWHASPLRPLAALSPRVGYLLLLASCNRSCRLTHELQRSALPCLARARIGALVCSGWSPSPTGIPLTYRSADLN